MLLTLDPLFCLIFGVIVLLPMTCIIVLLHIHKPETNTVFVFSKRQWAFVGAIGGIVLGMVIPQLWYNFFLHVTDSQGWIAALTLLDLPVTMTCGAIGGAVGGCIGNKTWQAVLLAPMGAVIGSLLACVVLFT